MNQILKKLTGLTLAALLTVPAISHAQEVEKEVIIEKRAKGEKGEKGAKGEKGEKGEKNEERIVIVTTDGSDEKLNITVNGDEVLVNGKKIDENDKKAKVRVMRTKNARDMARAVTVQGYPSVRYSRGFFPTEQNMFSWSDVDENRAMLGVSTTDNETGVEILSVNNKSAAEKAGLKKGDVIYKVENKKMEKPGDLTEFLKDKKPGDKVTVHYYRDNKDQKANVELQKWSGAIAYNFDNQNMVLGQAMGEYDKAMREYAIAAPRVRTAMNNFDFYWNDEGRLGLSVQETEDGKGVKVLEVDEESNAAKAGVKENDIILSIDGKEVNTTEVVRDVMKDAKSKISVPVELQRDGKKMKLDVKIPRKLKKAEI